MDTAFYRRTGFTTGNRRVSYEMRVLLQYDTDSRRVLTNFLASYELVPGTVFHAGYGSLFERGDGEQFPNDANSPVRLNDGYRATNRGLFFKASYLKRF